MRPTHGSPYWCDTFMKTLDILLTTLMDGWVLLCCNYSNSVFILLSWKQIILQPICEHRLPFKHEYILNAKYVSMKNRSKKLISKIVYINNIYIYI